MARTDDVKTVALGLQGGGSHCAFAWGVLDELLDMVAEGSVNITAISGSSGGALNGAVCAYGLLTSPREAKRLLEAFWVSVSDQSLWPEPSWRSLLPKDCPRRWNVDWDPLAIGVGMAEQIMSPYWNTWPGQEILGALLTKVIGDFGAIGATIGRGPRFFVSATAVNSTALRIFGPGEITLDAVLASACLPTFFRAVEIGGTPYWDGGYLANPALNPLLNFADDLLTILIDPLNVEHGPPITPRQIVNRINEVSFNSSWVLEMRQIELINQLLRKGHLRGTKYREKRFHLISNDRFMGDIGTSSKIVPSRDFLFALRDAGRRTAQKWAAENFAKVGLTSSIDVKREVALRLSGSPEAIAAARA